MTGQTDVRTVRDMFALLEEARDEIHGWAPNSAHDETRELLQRLEAFIENNRCGLGAENDG